VLALLVLLAACSPPQATQSIMQVEIAADGQNIPLKLPAGSTVQQALESAGITLGGLDRVEPPTYTLLTNGASLRVVRVREEFTIQEEVIPFERQVLQSESLSDQQKLLVQNGVNGVREITYRRVSENGEEVSNTAVKAIVVKEAIPEIMMVGVRTPFTPVEIPGRLVYLLGSNAWMMDGSSANRKPLINTGDLDGRVFSLSEDGKWLLYTRRASEGENINSLWVADLSSEPIKEIDLKVANIVHFADWIPGSTSKVAFSTVEPRASPPGWQANNDLNALSFSTSGWISNWKAKPVVDANSGGVYGWWGMSFTWSADGQRLAYARPDSVGVLDFKDGLMSSVLDVTPLQTGGDWAWVPGVAWGADGKVLYTVNHAAPEDSQLFNLTAVPLEGGSPIELALEPGMFAYPAISPSKILANGEVAYQIAYLRAVFPRQSESSPYRLVIMDRDGSNQNVLFPPQGEPGLEPQQVAWSPASLPNSGNNAVAVLYQGNLWLVDSVTGEARQVTGDGLIKRINWR
jgi:hypothetical protein